MLPIPTTSTVRALAGVYASSLLLEWASDLALMVAVYAATGSATAAGAMLVCTQLLPNIGIAALAHRLDPLDARPVLTVALGARGIALLAVAAFGFGPVLFLAAAIAGAGAAMARAQLRAGLARLEHEHPGTLRHGNGLLAALRGPCALGGPVLGGVAVALAGAEGALVILGALQLVVSLASRLAPSMPPVIDVVASEPGSADVADARQREGRLPVSFGTLVVAATLFAFAFSVDEPILMKYTDEVLGAGVGGYSAYFVAFGVGMLLGGACFGRVSDRSMVTVFAVGLAVNAMGHLGLVLAPSLAWALGAASVAGFGSGLDWPAITTLVQEHADVGQESRAAARFESFTNVGIGLGVLCGGAVADLLGARLTLFVPIFAAAAILLAIAALYLRARRWRVPEVPRLSPSIQGGVS